MLVNYIENLILFNYGKYLQPAVSSRVTITPREIPSRQEVLRRENTDERSRQRNKRMFGALLGTLQKFCQEETKLKAKVSIQLILFM